MKLLKFKKTTESEKMLNQIQSEHEFLDNAKKFPLPNHDEIDFDIDSINTYWVQKENLWTKKQKKQSTKEHTIENIKHIDQNISSENTNRYMWKIMKDFNTNKNREYTPEFIVWSLQYLFTKIPNGKVNFVIWPVVSKLMNWPKDVSGAMSESEQIAFIKYLTYQYFPDRINDLNIIPIQENHKDLFLAMGLKDNEEDNDKSQEEKSKNKLELNNPLDGLDVEELPQLDPQNISSLHIAQHLYAVCKNNKDFNSKIRGVTPSKATKNNNASYYYWLVEIAIRLTDYLKWITIQWWKYGQGKYDQFIKTIIMSNHSDHWRDELDNLSEFCQEILKDKDQKFATIHLKTEKYKEKIYKQKEFNYDRLQENKKKLKTLKWISSATTIALLATLWYIGFTKHQEQKRVKEWIEKVVTSRLDDIKNLSIWFEGKPRWLDKTQSKEQCNYYIETASNYFIKRYWKWDFSESEIKWMITSSIMNKDILQDIWYNTWQSGEVINEFIDNEFIKQHEWELMVWRVPLDPQDKYKKYNYNFKKTVNYQQQDKDYLRQNFQYNTKEIEDHNVEEIGEYITKDWSKYIIGKVRVNLIASERIWHIMHHAMDDLIVAKLDYSQQIKDSKGSKDRKFWQSLEKRSIKDWLDVSLDYFLQRESKIQKTIDAFVYCYAAKFPKEYFNSFWNFKEIEWRNKTKELIMEYFIKNNIQDSISENSENQTSDIMKFIIEDFIPNNQDTLLSYGINIKPYNRYEKYKDVFLNTKNFDISNDLLYIPNHYDYDFHILEDWFYQTQDGIIYSIWYIIYEGKKYIVADEKETEYAYTDYNLQDGKKVALDYLNTVNQYKKAYSNLQQKKQKALENKKYTEKTSKYIKETLYYHNNKHIWKNNKKYKNQKNK